MTQIKKLEKVIGEWDDKSNRLKQESSFARKHNFSVEATILYDKAQIIEEICREIRLKVIEQLINM